MEPSPAVGNVEIVTRPSATFVIAAAVRLLVDIDVVFKSFGLYLPSLNLQQTMSNSVSSIPLSIPATQTCLPLIRKWTFQISTLCPFGTLPIDVNRKKYLHKGFPIYMWFHIQEYLGNWVHVLRPCFIRKQNKTLSAGETSSRDECISMDNAGRHVVGT